MTERYRIAAAVTAGGLSTRMGQPKESVVIPGDGRTFLQKICDEVDKTYPAIIKQRYLSVRPDQNTERPGYVRVDDIYEKKGPLGAVASVLTRAKDDGYDAVLFLACDLISYDHTEIERICRRYDGEDILFARTGECDIQPLASIYAVEVAEYAEKQIKAGNYRVRDLASLVERVGYHDADPGFYEDKNTGFV